MVCGQPLLDGEEHLCLHCLYRLPWREEPSFRHNDACLRLAGRLPFDKATAALAYQKESSVQTLFEAFKYHGNKRVAVSLAAMAARRLAARGFFDDIDCLIPVPLHAAKQRLRGYNQAACIAQGLSSVTALPVLENVVQRAVANTTQTRKSRWQRQEEVYGIFSLVTGARLDGARILLVDDVLTTGATLDACGRVLWQAGPSSLNIFALALA